MAYITRIRVDGEGENAAALEERFDDVRVRIERALDSSVHKVAQVIELGADRDTHADWYVGRTTFSIQLDGMLGGEDVHIS